MPTAQELAHELARRVRTRGLTTAADLRAYETLVIAAIADLQASASRTGIDAADVSLRLLGLNLTVGGRGPGDYTGNVRDFLTQVHKTYVVANVSLSGGGTLEKGVVGGHTISLSGAMSPGNDTITARRLKQGNTVLSPAPTGNSVSRVVTGITADTTFTLEADTVASGTRSASTQVTLVGGSFYGMVTSLTPDEATVNSLTKFVQNGGGRALTFTNNNQRVAFAEPASQGIRTIKDQNQNPVTDDWQRTTVSYRLPDGTAEAYHLYVLIDPAGDGTPYTYLFNN